jgi:hypothetical protein
MQLLLLLLLLLVLLVEKILKGGDENSEIFVIFLKSDVSSIHQAASRLDHI